MACYKDVKAYREKLETIDFDNMTRKALLRDVVHARIQKVEAPYHDEATTRAVLFCQHFKFFKDEHSCPDCGEQCTLHNFKACGSHDTSWVWLGPQYDDACSSCIKTRVSIATGTLLEGVPTKHWLTFLEAMNMWWLEYPKGTIINELDLSGHTTANRWMQRFQDVTVQYMKDKIIFKDLHHELKGQCQLHPKAVMKGVKKKPASSTKVRKSILKKPAKSTLAAARTSKVVLQMDETCLNKRRASKLSKKGRPQKNQIWVQGFVIQNFPEIFMFNVMKHPDDCYDGKTRGKEEILRNLKQVGPPKGTIVVSDKWRATVAAVKQYRADMGFTENQLPHEIVNHSAGEICNDRGFTTNLIESKWSVFKRWVRRVHSGRMPNYSSDRTAWSRLLSEFQFRQYVRIRGVGFVEAAAQC